MFGKTMRWEVFRHNVNGDSGIVNTYSGKNRKAFTLNQNGCSRYAGISVHVEPEWVFMMGRNTQKEYYSEEMDGLSSNISIEKIHSTLEKEYKAEKLFSVGEYSKACGIAQSLCDSCDDDLERGWYMQLMARYKYRLSKVDANELQKSAFQRNLQLLKPKDGVSYKKLKFVNQNRVNRIVQWMKNYQNYADMMLALDGMLQNLSFGMPSEKFELSLKELGDCLGFLSQRPDKEIKKGPDNLWCGVDEFFFMLECKNEVGEDRAGISKHEAGQMNSHSAWFESVYNEEKCKRILIIPTKKLSYHGDFTHEVEVMRKGSLRKLKGNVKAFFREFSKYSPHYEISDDKVQQFINAHKLDLENLKNEYSEAYVKSGK